MIITAQPYSTMSICELKAELVGWDRMLAAAVRFGLHVDLVKRHRDDCAAEIERRQAQGVAA